MRYKEFNTNRVLEKCIKLFWNKGFGACSVKDIVKETSVNRFSLYNEFESKEGILFAALNLYEQRYRSVKMNAEYRKKSIEEELVAFFGTFLLDDNLHPPGCFTIHIATELADHNEEVKSVLNEYSMELEDKFYNLLNRFQPHQNDNTFYAKHLVALFCSSMCHCVIQSKQERIQHIRNSIKVLLNKKSEHATYA